MTKLKTFDLFERLPVAMFVKARDGRYLGVNKAWEEMFGMPAASFVGKEVRDLYPQNPEIAELHAARDRELWERPGAQSYAAQIVTPDGRRRDTIYYKATYPSEGEAQGLVGAIFDVTARARAESALRESEERFRAVVDSANEGMLIYDRSLNIIAGNRAAERIVGLPLAQLIGKPGFTSLLPCVRADGTPLPETERPKRASGAPSSWRAPAWRTSAWTGASSASTGACATSSATARTRCSSSPAARSRIRTTSTSSTSSARRCTRGKS